MDRRHFISHLGRNTAASGIVATAAPKAAGASAEREASAAPLPTIALGSHQVTRLVVGANPLSGYSYLGPHTDRHMKEYFTVERSVDFLLACERAGINTHQFSYSTENQAPEILSKVRDRGSKMKFFCLARTPDEIRAVKTAARPIAVVHHGGVTDRRFAEGKSQLVHDFVKAAHDHGLLAGVSAHNPDCIQKVADDGWDVDFFMTCFYFLTRKTFHKPGEPKQEPETLYLTYPFYRRDPEIMTRVVRQVDKPCLGFKILAAGRKCSNPSVVRDAFRFAFSNIKPTDGVIVGMYPRFFDEITANAEYTREYGDPSRQPEAQTAKS
ncbi:MAG: hypothetical protein ACC628_25425 [Pirellulaceae bacterium]